MLWRFTKIIVENADTIEQIKKIVVEKKNEKSNRMRILQGIIKIK